MRSSPIGVFDLDGTLLDTDEALLATFEALGVAREEVTFGHVLSDACASFGLSVAEYIDRYDHDLAQPFPGVAELVAGLDRWAVCSNKHPRSGRAELERLGWTPEVALFSDAFDGPKQLAPVLAALGVDAASVVFVGDTEHDRACAAAAGCPFVLAGWNPRTEPAPGDLVAATPADVATILATTHP
ncbi:MAG: gph [Acidimicrobiales bacterium]|nr:gph [Acidimicrobiales bacterium]